MLCAILFSIIIVPSLGARILGVVPTPSYSHQIVFHPIWKELSLRGHQVTVLTTDPINNSSLTNLTEINLHFSYKQWNKMNMVNLSQTSITDLFDNFVKLGVEMIEEQLQHPQVQNIINNQNEHFDLVMIECIFPAMYAFVERFKCPFIALSSLDTSSTNHEAIGNPAHPILNPDFLLPCSGEVTFLERLKNVFVSLFIKYYTQPHIYHTQQLLVQKYFGDGYPLLEDILKNLSLLFINIDPILHQIRPLVPATIPIGGGTHIRPSKPLPKDLQKMLDSATQGFIYFSLGTNVKSKELSEEIRHAILDTFAELPYLVLWKFELEDLPGKPDNVIISKWFPQQDIFKHPNIKLFITQGGLQSMEEAIYNYIPIVGMPFIGDQPTNVKNIVAKGFGLSLDYKTMDKALFKSTVLEVINNPKYRNRVKELGELAKDQPTTGLERAIWWTEYVLRHKGAKHLRSPAIDLPSYQYFLLDVIGFCLLVVMVIAFLLVNVIKLIFKFLNIFKSKTKIKMQ